MLQKYPFPYHIFWQVHVQKKGFAVVNTVVTTATHYVSFDRESKYIRKEIELFVRLFKAPPVFTHLFGGRNIKIYTYLYIPDSKKA